MKSYIIDVEEHVTAEDIAIAMDCAVDYSTIHENEMKCKIEIESRIMVYEKCADIARNNGNEATEEMYVIRLEELKWMLEKK